MKISRWIYWMAFVLSIGFAMNAGHIAADVLLNEMFSCGWG